MYCLNINRIENSLTEEYMLSNAHVNHALLVGNVKVVIWI